GEYTILQLAETIQKMVNPNVEVQYKPLPQDDPKRRQPDITKARQLLDWEPTVPLQEGLEKTIADFRARMAEAGTLSKDLTGTAVTTPAS
ncbi:MAG: SDR family NAD-dependent epimerase/dehydratase, partial [Cyanobacteria bacterium J06607_13]